MVAAAFARWHRWIRLIYRWLKAARRITRASLQRVAMARWKLMVSRERLEEEIIGRVEYARAEKVEETESRVANGSSGAAKAASERQRHGLRGDDSKTYIWWLDRRQQQCQSVAGSAAWMTPNARCSYGVLARVPTSVAANASADVRPGDDLLLAFVTVEERTEIWVFARQIKNRSCVCRNDSASRTLRLGFHCPHLVGAGDFWPLAVLPVDAVTQVWMTYRTAGSAGVAVRTRDLLLRCRDGCALWLEFEHNLARGWFLEALSAAGSGGACDVDYVDLSERGALLSLTQSVDLQRFVARYASPSSRSTELQRAALRLVTYDKIKLSLQISQEGSVDDEHCHFLLATAMELSAALDEPDLHAFTWLTSAFINMQSTHASKRDLALTQVTYSIELAKQNSLHYLTCLALHCAADLYVHRDDPAMAKELLVEAAKLMPVGDAMDPALKMQVHRKIHELREVVELKHAPKKSEWSSVRNALLTARDSGELAAKKSRSAFNLWAYTFGSMQTSTTDRPSSPRKWLLQEPVKAVDAGGSCFVDVLGAHGARKARFRVFFDGSHTFAWLQEHVRRRIEVVLATAQSADSSVLLPARVEMFYDPQRRLLVTDLQSRLCDWAKDKQNALLHAKLALAVQSTHRSSQLPVDGPVVVERLTQEELKSSGDGPTVTCSMCKRKIPLASVEEHSEACC
ncbi:hypothetical protein P43SY_008912 [Pythium insidiosum]|uniref:Uncharacterized protein n=1 Tax=Pythium insidiosum TaxID=114742 RepID=A0AAD5Q899_PYTIN|nr:hypothetical protein P43SY_008912 [Pythium insidiosum]